MPTATGGFEILRDAARENAKAFENSFDELDKPRREKIDLALWRKLPDSEQS